MQGKMRRVRPRPVGRAVRRVRRTRPRPEPPPSSASSPPAGKSRPHRAPAGPKQDRPLPRSRDRSAPAGRVIRLEEPLQTFAAGALFFLLLFAPPVLLDLAPGNAGGILAVLVLVGFLAAAYVLGHFLLSFTHPLFWLYERLWSAVPGGPLEDIAALLSEARAAAQELPLPERAESLLWEMPECLYLETAWGPDGAGPQAQFIERSRSLMHVRSLLASLLALGGIWFLVWAAGCFLHRGALPRPRACGAGFAVAGVVLLGFSLGSYHTWLAARKEYLERLLVAWWAGRSGKKRA